MALPQALQYISGLLTLRIRRLRSESCSVGRPLGGSATPDKPPSSAGELSRPRRCPSLSPPPPRTSSSPDLAFVAGRTFRRHTDWLFGATQDRAIDVRHQFIRRSRCLIIPLAAQQ